LEKWKFDAEMSVQSGGALGTSVFFWSENSLFSDWLQETTKTYGGKTFLLGHSHKTVMGFGHRHHEESQWSAVTHT
jgi:hypothetical protein